MRFLEIDLTPHPPSLQGKGERNAPLRAGEGTGVRLLEIDLTPHPPSLQGKGERHAPLLAGEGQGVR